MRSALLSRSIALTATAASAVSASTETPAAQDGARIVHIKPCAGFARLAVPTEGEGQTREPPRDSGIYSVQLGPDSTALVKDSVLLIPGLLTASECTTLITAADAAFSGGRCAENADG